MEASRRAAEEREATLQTTIQDQRTQLTEADEKFNTAISSFQDIATAQIASLTQELRATQGTFALFLMKYETVERERARLYEDLLEHQTAAMREREAEHTRHTTEMDRATQEFGKKLQQLIAETEPRVKTMVTSYDIITGKL